MTLVDDNESEKWHPKDLKILIFWKKINKKLKNVRSISEKHMQWSWLAKFTLNLCIKKSKKCNIYTNNESVRQLFVHLAFKKIFRKFNITMWFSLTGYFKLFQHVWITSKW